tara:strand:- start:1606 stop:2709 length:1104 start_codon:yes stop_codon:yes gene_type:complete
MLQKMSVKNFRNFDEWFLFDLSTDKNYEFNSEAISNGIVKHSMVFGQNGSGKSNIGLALLDLTCHLTDNFIMPSLSQNYLNANNGSNIAEFEYVFKFGDCVVEYSYGKSDCETAVYECLKINSIICISIDRRKSQIATFNMEGAKGLKNDLENSNISAIKYLNSNAVLDSNSINDVFIEFIEFVDGMLFFRTLNRQADYSGQNIDSKRLSKAIIESDKLNDFETFLNQAGIECKLKISGSSDNKVIAFDFGEKDIEFSIVASTGTMSLGIFYYWWLRLDTHKLKFAYIDEFDAYYHHELSTLIVEKLTNVDCQTILTTHNTSIMTNDLLRPDCYFVLIDGKQYRLHELVNKDLRKAHNLEKIFKGLK